MGRVHANPHEAVDSDGDRMGDTFEWLIVDDNEGDALDSFADVLPAADYDDDGTLNLTEFRLGTDPTSWTEVRAFSPAWIAIALVCSADVPSLRSRRRTSRKAADRETS